MKAIRIHPEDSTLSLQLESIDTPQPLPNQILIRSVAAGVNHADLMALRLGQDSRNTPTTPGLDVAGTVEAIGENITKFKRGDRVMALVRGGYAEFVTAREALASRIPETISFIEAASIPCVFLTAWYGLTTLGRLQQGERVLIHAAGSGVGTAGIQLAKALGAIVYTTAGTDLRVARGIALGADSGINYSTEDLTLQLLHLTGGSGVNVVLDNVGGSIFDTTLPALAEGGRIVNVGSPAGTRTTIDEATTIQKNQHFYASQVFNNTQEDTEGAGWQQINKWISDGTVRTIIDRILPWTEAKHAHQLLRSRSIFGKIVLTID
jgi:NADPH2:quinone reductase